MRKWFLFILLLFPIIGSAQGFTLDTIRVSPEDRRNIHQNRQVDNNHQLDYNQQTQQNRQTEQSARSRNKNNLTFDKSKLRFGANLGLSLSSNYTHLGIGPQIGYDFNQYFMAGAGVRYNHLKRKLSDYERRSNLLGLNLFGYFYPVRFITMFIQPEINYIWSNIKYNQGDTVSNSGFAPSLVMGAGLRLGYTHVTINYDLIQHRRSPHPAGYFFGVSAFF